MRMRFAKQSPDEGSAAAPILDADPIAQPEGQGDEGASGTPAEQTYTWAGRQVPLSEYLAESQKLASEFTRKSQENAELRGRVSELESVTKQQEPPASSAMTPEEEKQLQDAARLLAPYIKDMLKGDVGEVVEERLNASLSQKERLTQMQSDLVTVEGWAKEMAIPFDTNEYLAFLKQQGTADIKGAFKNRYEDQWIDYKVKERGRAKDTPTVVKGSPPPLDNTPKTTDMRSKDFNDYLVNKLNTMAKAK